MGTDHHLHIKPRSQNSSKNSNHSSSQTTHHLATIAQRTANLPNGRLEISELMQLQQAIGNIVTQRMLNKSARSGVIQRQYTGVLLNYDDMENEKDSGEIHTGFKWRSSLTKRVKALHIALQKGSFKEINSALKDINVRLKSDSGKKLKKSKNSNIDSEKRKALAQQFFTKWQQVTQDHLDYLEQHGGKGVTDLQQAYGYVGVQQGLLLDTESSVDGEKGGAFSFNAPLWNDIASAQVVGSGKGGAVIVTFKGGDRLVVKRKSPGEVMGARMARESGLEMPETRLADNAETDEIKEALLSVGVDEQKKWESPYTVIEFVDGTLVTEAFTGSKKVDKKRVTALADSMGRWFAFNILTGDNDNFNRLVGMNTMGGVNTGNYMVDSKNPNKVTAIDQTVMGGDALKKAGDALENILAGDGMFALNIANDIVKALGSPNGVDGDNLIPVIMNAAKAQLQQSTRVLTREKLVELNQDLDLHRIEDVIERVESIAKHF